MLAGPGVRGADILVQQNEDILKAAGMPDDAAKAYGNLYKIFTDDIIVENDTTVLLPKMMSDFEQWKTNQTDDMLQELKVNKGGANDKKIVKAFAAEFASPWMKYFLQADPQPSIEKLNCKVLALNGSKDIQVNAAMNLAAIHNALKKSKSPSFETKEIPGLNHLFQHCKKCTVSEYAELEETFAPEALEIMWNWLEKNGL